VAIVLVNERTGEKFEALTDESGAYSLVVPTGMYRADISLAGYETLKESALAVTRGDRVRVRSKWLSLTTPSPDMPRGAARTDEEWNIREAVYRYQFAHNASSVRARAAVYCLSVSATDETPPADPPSEFMRRFASDMPVVKAQSECSKSERGVLDRQTGGRGLVFSTTLLRWASSTEVEVSGGYFRRWGQRIWEHLPSE